MGLSRAAICQGAEAAIADLIRQQQQRRPGARRGGGGGPRVELQATLEAVLAAGHDLAREQQAVLDLQLSKQVRRRKRLPACAA
jgi:hypothetical protein